MKMTATFSCYNENKSICSSTAGHEQMNVLMRVEHELSFVGRADGGEAKVVVFGVQDGAGHVAVGPALAVEKCGLHKVAHFREKVGVLRQLIKDLKWE